MCLQCCQRIIEGRAAERVKRTRVRVSSSGGEKNRRKERENWPVVCTDQGEERERDGDWVFSLVLIGDSF